MNYKILIVDDNPHIINNIVDILEEEYKNYNFYQANNGEMAYRIASKNKLDLVITDWDMPVVNGIELIKKLQENKTTKDIPVIMATAVMLTSNDLKLALESGAVDYIRKPIDAVELIARTQSALKISYYHKQLLERKDAELAQNALFLIRNNKFNISITKKLQNLHDSIKDVSDETSERFEEIINEIDKKVKEDSWKNFEISFNSVNADFQKNLLSKYPSLTASDLKLCIFLKSGMSSKDIASVLYMNASSVKVSRYRLRKKLNLQQDTNLQTFLTSF